MKYGESTLSHDLVYRGGDPNRKEQISFAIYLIRVGRRNLLVDAGCETMPGFEMKHFCSPTEILERYGMRAEEISDVIITHAHHDHIAALDRFSGATLWIQEEEYKKGGKYIPSSMRVRTFVRSASPTKGVRIKRIGGHSIGSSIVLADGGEKTLLFCGDECYVKRCLTEGIPTGASKCPEKSLAFIKCYSDGSYQPLLCHDPSLLPGENGFLIIC